MASERLVSRGKLRERGGGVRGWGDTGVCAWWLCGTDLGCEINCLSCSVPIHLLTLRYLLCLLVIVKCFTIIYIFLHQSFTQFFLTCFFLIFFHCFFSGLNFFLSAFFNLLFVNVSFSMTIYVLSRFCLPFLSVFFFSFPSKDLEQENKSFAFIHKF